MNRRISLTLVTLALLAAACGGGSTSDDFDPMSSDSVPAGTAAPTTTTEVPATTAPPASTDDAPTTTTTEAPVTTTTIVSSAELVALQGAIERSSEVTSGEMEGLILMTGLDPSQGLDELRIPFGGAFDNAAGNFSFYMDMSSIAEAAGDELPPEFAGLFDEMEVRQIGDTAYMKFGLFAMLFGAETEWISMPAEEGGDATADFSMASPGNPAEILASFEEAGATVEVLGTESVNGLTATHYRAVFDMEALLATATPEERARLEAQGPLPTDALPMDVWISEDGFVVRFVMTIDGSSVQTAPGESFESMTMQYDLFNLGGDVTIEPPPDSDVTDIEDLEGSFGS